MSTRYRWATSGDINAFFGLMLDNVVNLAVLAGILVSGFGFPASLVYTRMFPGTALGVLFGDVVYTVMAIRLARRTGRDDVTAMPLGLDAPSTIGMALTVLGPAFLAAKTRMPSDQLIQIFLSQVYNGALMSAAIDPVGTMKATGIANADFIATCAVMVMLAHGFILTAMLWGGAVAFLIDRRIGAAAATFGVCAVLAFFGFIHSVTPSGGIYFPWHVGSTLPYHWAAAYLAFAASVAALGQTRAFREKDILHAH